MPPAPLRGQILRLSDRFGILRAMGKSNQQRRAAKRRRRAASNAAGRSEPNRPADDPGADAGEPQANADAREATARLLVAGADAAFGDNVDESALDHVVQSLVVRSASEPAELAAVLATDWLLQLTGLLWENGWQPIDLAHMVRRHQGVRGSFLITAVIGQQALRAGLADRAPAEWTAQLESLGVSSGARSTAGPPVTSDWLITAWLAGRGIPIWDGWRDVLKLIGQLQNLHRLTPLGPPPSAWKRTASKAGSAGTRPPAASAARRDPPAEHDPRMLSKIRALLSKAEATTFVEEAEAFTAKAQDLMTRYAIDEALLEDSAGEAEVAARRIHIDNPYAEAKVQLLSTVGAINRVRVVWDDHHGMASVVGMAVDLQLVEMLFTSLLVQATRALTEAGNAPPAQPGYRSGRLNRSPSFRRAFLLAYATRVGERLAEADRRAGAEAGSSHGTELIPVLARRSEAVDSAFDRLFPETREIRAKRVDARGWQAGREAADRAVFAAGQVGGG